jgi:hypothetical protein
VTNCFLGILRHEAFQVSLGILVFEEGSAGAAKDADKL